MNKLAHALLALVCAVGLLDSARADIVDSINRTRQRGCERKAGVKAAFRPSRDLDAVAREWSKGGRLRDALARTDYRVVNSSSMRVIGASDESTVLDILASEYCDVIVDATLTEIGVYQRKGGVWIVVATPFVTPAPQDAQQVSRRVLALVNQARAQPRKCGRSSHPPAPPLTLSPLLARAALAHAQDMAAHNFFEHRGSDGSRPADRVTRTTYAWRTVGENIAVGAPDADAVVRGWLDSPGHCTNIMGPQFSEMGIAYFADRRNQGGIYWAQVFASPR